MRSYDVLPEKEENMNNVFPSKEFEISQLYFPASSVGTVNLFDVTLPITAPFKLQKYLMAEYHSIFPGIFLLNKCAVTEFIFCRCTYIKN